VSAGPGQDGQFLIGLEIIEGRSVRLLVSLVVLANHVHNHSQGFQKKPGFGTLQNPLAVRRLPHRQVLYPCGPEDSMVLHISSAVVRGPTSTVSTLTCRLR
jgi:hypothetical protein